MTRAPSERARGRWPREAYVFVVGSEHPWPAWHGDLVVGVGEPTWDSCDGDESYCWGIPVVSDFWSGPHVPVAGLIPLTPAARALLKAAKRGR